MNGILEITIFILLVILLGVLILFINFLIELPNVNWSNHEEVEKTSVNALLYPFILIIISSLITIAIMTYLKY
jgi:cell shape-determining protein MreD